MERNVGNTDRGFRIFTGVVIIAAGVAYDTWWGALGVVPIITGLLGWCPPYSCLGINTCKRRTRSS